jgi:hypothetical protein
MYDLPMHETNNINEQAVLLIITRKSFTLPKNNPFCSLPDPGLNWGYQLQKLMCCLLHYPAVCGPCELYTLYTTRL